MAVEVPLSMEHESNEIEYRSVSVFAIASVILGLLSLTALIFPAFWAVPALAALAALAGFRQTRNQRMTGRKLAVCGMFLAAFFGAMAPTWHYFRRATIYQISQGYAESWLNLVRDGKLEEAHQLNMPPALRAPSDITLKEYYANLPEQMEALEAFFSDGPIQILVKQAQKGELHFVKHVNQTRDSIRDHAVHRYRLDFPREGETVSVVFDIHLMRRYDYRETEVDPCHWEVRDIVKPLNP